MKILIVDDNPVNRRIPMIMLSKLGVAVMEVESGALALDCVRTDEAISHILLDVNMPGMSGNEVCARLRADPQGKRLHIVAYTAHAFPDEKERIMAAGFDDLLIKPFKREALLSVLRLD